MSAAPPTDLVPVTIDGQEIAVPKGTNVIEAARRVGVDVPFYCYHPKLSVVGNCRMCLVELGQPAVDLATKAPVMDPVTGRQRIDWIPRPQIGCATNVTPGLHVRTQTPQIKACREGVMEFLLINHPLDCPICDQAGECKLQEQATGYGRGYSRFIEQKNVKPKRTQLGPRVMLDDERCILCSRCIRFCKEIAKDDVLGFTDRGSYSTLTCYPGRQLTNNYSLNTVDLCPVGALTSTDFRFKMRVWFLKQTPGIDPESSAGANTVVWSREGVIYRITPRDNDAVNDSWMADSGRELYKQVRSPGRLAGVRVAGTPAALDAAVAQAGELFRAAAGRVAVVGSGRSSVEEQWLTRRLTEALQAPAWLVSRVGEGDGLLVSADRNPNVRGALVTGLIRSLPTQRLDELTAAIDAGRVTTVVVVGEDLAAAGLTRAQLAKVKIVHLGTAASPTSEAAVVLLPALTLYEKAGCFVNQQFRLQRFQRAVPGPAGAHDDLELLARLIGASGGAVAPADLAGVWREVAAALPALAGRTFTTVPDLGLALDPAPFAGLPFIEGPGLHYTPAKG